ncbi:hypothetical protein CBR_g31218 [Chara braunii]|uniref:Uncharacterized protein n=1 Tax=Chara braunii TaxID=69332 RepID=A0A388JXW2_CHABU|nr:hypothetical protein CBR_g31218 [Chara braunii]|eukprot:GBG62582.1 hypothetical protein CBR_g31218 [Chara braunii]
MADVHMDGAYVPAPAPAAAGREMSEAPAALTGGGGSVASRGPQRKKRTVHQNLGGGKCNCGYLAMEINPLEWRYSGWDDVGMGRL